MERAARADRGYRGGPDPGCPLRPRMHPEQQIYGSVCIYAARRQLRHETINFLPGSLVYLGISLLSVSIV
jgi:hypothetical protein